MVNSPYQNSQPCNPNFYVTPTLGIYTCLKLKIVLRRSWLYLVPWVLVFRTLRAFAPPNLLLKSVSQKNLWIRLRRYWTARVGPTLWKIPLRTYQYERLVQNRVLAYFVHFWTLPSPLTSVKVVQMTWSFQRICSLWSFEMCERIITI